MDVQCRFRLGFDGHLRDDIATSAMSCTVISCRIATGAPSCGFSPRGRSEVALTTGGNLYLVRYGAYLMR